MITCSILLVTDDAARDRELRDLMGAFGACSAVTIDEVSAKFLGSENLIIVRGKTKSAQEAAELRRFLSKSSSATPILWVVHNRTHAETARAYALGATKIITDDAPQSIIREVKAAIAEWQRSERNRSKIVRVNAKHTAQAFAGLFAAGADDQPIDEVAVGTAVESVTEAVQQAGISRWVELVSTYDDVTYQHCLLVAGFAAAFAESLGLAQEDRHRLTEGAVLHDLGKAKIPLAILNKPAALTDEEWSVMRTHPRAGYELLLAQGTFAAVMLDVVLHHHERLDGSGYPDGLMGGSISDLVRLTTICDIYASLLQRRPYKAAMSAAQAFEIMESMDGKLEKALIRSFRATAARCGPK